MTAQQEIPIAFLSERVGTIECLRETLMNNPESSVIAVTQVGHVPQNSLLHGMSNALNDEKISAVEALPISKELLSQIPPGDLVYPVARLSNYPVVFRADLLRDYLSSVEEQFGPSVSLDELGIFFNTLGYTTVRTCVDESLSNDLQSGIARSGVTREWDAYVDHVAQNWERHRMSPLQLLAQLPNNVESPLELLIDASGLEPIPNGTSRVVLSVIDAAVRSTETSDRPIRVTLVAPKPAVEFFELDGHDIVISPEVNALSGIFHVAIAATPLTTVDRLITLNKICGRLAVLHLDIIAVRAFQFLSQQDESIATIDLYLRFADRVFCISAFTAKDTQNFFRVQDRRENISVIHLGTSELPAAGESNLKAVSHDDFVLVLGNKYPHKQVGIVTLALLKAGRRVTTVGVGKTLGQHHNDIPAIDATDASLSSLMSSARIIVFPSRYEGFGLPILEAAATGKPLFLWESEVSREISELVPPGTSLFFCSGIHDLVTSVSREFEQATASKGGSVRTMSDFGDDLISELLLLGTSPLQVTNTVTRWQVLNDIGAVLSSREEATRRKIAAHNWRSRLPAPIRRFLR